MALYSSVYACTYCLLASTWRPLVSVITALYYVAMRFHRRVWYDDDTGIARFLCAMRVFEVRDHPHALCYLCVKFRFFGDLHC